MEYEGLMALTNILSMSQTHAPKDRFITLRGIAAVEYCQFSSHPQVRTAATECFVNVVYHADFIKYMLNNDGERFKLWISFAESFLESDENNRPVGYNNARAAMGGLAMMSDVPGTFNSHFTFPIESANNYAWCTLLSNIDFSLFSFLFSL